MCCFVFIFCWNQHMASIEMYIFSVDVVLITCWNICMALLFWVACISGACQFQLQGQPIFNYYIILFEIQSHLCGTCESRVNFTLYFDSLTSVRVFTRIVSDNPWCNLLAIFSLRWKYNVTFTHWIPNHSRPESMTIKIIFFKWLWNLINFKKTFQTDLLATYLLGICSHFSQFTRRECEGHKCSQADARKYKLFFLFSMYLRSSNSLHSILVIIV